jgi:hypothetical protein
MIPVGKSGNAIFRKSCESARNRAREHDSSTPNVVLFDQGLVTRLVLALEIIEQ